MKSEVVKDEMSLADLVGIVVRRWRPAGLVLVVVLCLAFARLLVATPQFEARATLLVLTPNRSVSDLQTLQLYRDLVPTYYAILSSRRAMEAVLRELELNWSAEEYRKRIRIETDEESRTLTVCVRASSPDEAARIATDAAQVMARVAAEVMQDERLVLLDPAAPPERPVSPRPVLDIGLSMFLGLLVGAAVAFALEASDRRLRDESDIERRLGLPVLGIIPHIEP